MKFLLKPFELLYRGINRARRALYRSRVLKGRRLPKPVISIGNLSMGGAGKTPAVIAIARYLIERDYRVAVLTRGHGRRGSASGPVDALDPERFGDEPVLIKKKVPNANVIVGKNRYKNGLTANCDVYLLDDGFQHLQLYRDLDIVIDAPNARWYREGRSALRDYPLIIERWIRPVGIEPLKDRRLYAFAGLADNDQFFRMLRQHGLNLVGTCSFKDHARYSEEQIEWLRERAAARKADVLVTTEKDKVKIDAPDIVAIAIEMEIELEVFNFIEYVIRR